MSRLISDRDPGQGLCFAELDDLGSYLVEVLKGRCDELEVFQKFVESVVELREFKDGVAILSAEPRHYFAHGCFRCHRELPLDLCTVGCDEIRACALALRRFTRCFCAVKGFGA